MISRNIKEITPKEIKDFISVYKVFRGHPYYEDWTEKLIIEEFGRLTQYGKIYGYYTKGICVGIVTYRCTLQEDHPVYYEQADTVYLADIAVLKQYRGKGIGTKLMKYALVKMKEDGYIRVYMKTLEIGKSMSYNIAIEQGFQLLKGVRSIDTMKKIGKREEGDVKIYLTRKL